MTSGLNIGPAATMPTPDSILDDDTASHWLKAAIQDLMLRDPVDALNDAEELRNVMARHLHDTVKVAQVEQDTENSVEEMPHGA